MMARIITLLLLTLTTLLSSGQETDSSQVAKPKFETKIGGALRFNHNYSTWKPNQVKPGRDFGFEVIRLNIDAQYGRWGLHVDQRFYAQGFGGAFLKYGWFQYELNDNSHLKAGLLPAYFGVQQFNSHSWFFQLPFYLGFEDDHDMGASYSLRKGKVELDAGFYKNAEELQFSDNSPISDARYNYDFAGENKEVNQVNLRFNYILDKDKNHRIGTSLQYGGIWNIETQNIGSHGAMAIQYEGRVKRWNLKAQALSYDNRPENTPGMSRDVIAMTAYGAPYNTAARADIYSVGLSYTQPIKNSQSFQSIEIYSDYSYMDKSVAEWEDTQMWVTGLLISAKPMYIYIDHARGLHQPWLGPQWTDALSTGDPSNSWESRTNINLGYYF